MKYKRKKTASIISPPPPENFKFLNYDFFSYHGEHLRCTVDMLLRAAAFEFRLQSTHRWGKEVTHLVTSTDPAPVLPASG